MHLQVIHSSKFYILASCVYQPTTMNFSLICVYGDPHHKNTSLIWQDVSSFVLASPNVLLSYVWVTLIILCMPMRNVALNLLINVVSMISVIW